MLRSCNLIVDHYIIYQLGITDSKLSNGKHCFGLIILYDPHYHSNSQIVVMLFQKLFLRVSILRESIQRPLDSYYFCRINQQR